jgi:hypothetical protein
MTAIQKTVRAVFSIVILASLCSCGSLVRKRDKDEVGKVTTAAVIAFSDIEPQAVDIGMSLLTGQTRGKDGPSYLAANDPHTDKMYANLVAGFGDGMKWKMLPLDQMRANPLYVQVYKSTMEGFQNKMPLPKGQKQFLVSNVMDWNGPRIMGPQARDELIRALGVDALIVVRVDVVLHGTSIMGIGSRHPQSNLSFQVYTLGHENPIWYDGRIQGEESQESVGNTGAFDPDMLKRLAVKSADTAFAKIASSSAE